MRNAAFLWSGQDPGNGQIFDGTPEAAVLEMFRQAVQDDRFNAPDHFDRDNINIDYEFRRERFRQYAETITSRAASKFPF